MSATFISQAMHVLLAEERAINRRYREALELIGSGTRNATAPDIARKAIAFDVLVESPKWISAEPVTRCPKCGITVFQSSGSVTECCSQHAAPA